MKINLTRRQWLLLVIYNIGYFFTGVCPSVQAPFFPYEADKKGVPPSQFGFVFGVYFLTSFIASPGFGKLISQIGAILTSYMGLFIVGVSCILFGLLDKINGADLFLAFSMIIRITEALGTTAFKTAGFSIAAIEFPDNRATAFAILQSFLNIGLIIGPTVGGVLFEWQGYLAPFLFTGILLLITAISSAILLLRVDDYNNCKQSKDGFFLLLKQPEILLGTAATFGSYMNISFFQATLEPHLRTIQITPVNVGYLFMLNGIIVGFASPVWGILCDKWIPPQFVWSIGAIFVCICLLLMGPAPYFLLDLSLPLCACAIVIGSIGQAAEIVATFDCYSKVAIKIGYPDDVNTYGIVSALFGAACSLGGFVAPSMGGILFDNIGFPWAVHVLIGFQILLFIITLLYNYLYTENNFPKRKNNSFEAKSILENEEIFSYSTIESANS